MLVISIEIQVHKSDNWDITASKIGRGVSKGYLSDSNDDLWSINATNWFDLNPSLVLASAIWIYPLPL